MNSGQTLFSGKAQVAQKSWMIKDIYSKQRIQCNSCFQGKRKLLKNLEWWKYFNTVKHFRATLFFRASASCSKILNDKNISIQWIQGKPCFQGKRKLLKNPEWQKYFNTVKHFRANPAFRASASCSKILNDKNISIQWISGQLVFFRASASCSKILNDKKTYSIQWIQGTLFFRARASCSKILNVKVYSIQWKFSGQTLCFRASANSSKILSGKK